MRVLQLLTVAAALLVWQATFARAEQIPSAVIEVDGLSCPFCAYGLEKKLRQVNGVTKVDVQLKTGKVIVTLKPGLKVTDEALKKAVESAGFTPRAIERIEIP
jgi:mercuric ion binding protein